MRTVGPGGTHPPRTRLRQGARNQILTELSERGFRSIALETDRVAALAVNDFVHGGDGTFEDAMASGFSHGFGQLAANRELVAWLYEYNLGRPASERIAFHGFDAAMENLSDPARAATWRTRPIISVSSRTVPPSPATTRDGAVARQCWIRPPRREPRPRRNGCA